MANPRSSELGCRGWDWYGSTATTTTRKSNRTNGTKDDWSPRWECHPHSVYLLVVGTSAIKQLPVEFLVNTGTAVLVVKYTLSGTKFLRNTDKDSQTYTEKLGWCARETAEYSWHCRPYHSTMWWGDPNASNSSGVTVFWCHSWARFFARP